MKWLVFLFLGLSLTFAFLGFLNSLHAKKIQRRYQIPEDEIIYTDLDKPAKALYSDRYSLIGKPDYIVKHKGSFVPIEVKSRVVTGRPFTNHVLQLAAYCLLVEEQFKQSVPFGILQKMRWVESPDLKGAFSVPQTHY